jgi:uncharacterized membrane protein YidH (DUF202 family)
MTIDPPGEASHQSERTYLAWNRTALTAVVLGATTAKSGITDHSTADLAATVVSAIAACTTYVCSRWRHPQRRITDAPVGRTAILISAVSVVLAALAATIALVIDAASS